jgi:hypothetical protein
MDAIKAFLGKKLFTVDGFTLTVGLAIVAVILVWYFKFRR